MNSRVLKVPSSQKKKDWFQFINRSLQKTVGFDELLVDFNVVHFMDTDEFVMLACLIESYYINNSKILFVGGTPNFNDHLFNIKFKEYWKPGFNRDKFTFSKNHTTLCLWKISIDMIYSYSKYARLYFEKFTANKDLIPLASNMDEVFNNIFDHSQSPVTGYILTQYYPKTKKLSFSVCDYGIGIPTSVKNTDQKDLAQMEDWEAILKSLEKGFSVKSNPRNRGFGLNNILEFTENSKGRLLRDSSFNCVFV
ncbi:ATP-binding protein [Membranihabitans marinus]|uniref:ATP-binding protein n=1 Tax=Membranihabitans marinus TaxID=1227546 RepID=UPI001F2F716E|nr:ATP-binding protein [Membranihabitans marinus]